MNPIHLYKDEIDWELNIRGICTKNLSNRDIKISILRGHITCEKEKPVSYPEVQLNFEDELEICKNKIVLFSNLVKSFYSDKQHPSYKRYKSRLLHLLARINYLKPNNPKRADIKARLISQCMIIIDLLEERTKLTYPVEDVIDLIDMNNDSISQPQSIADENVSECSTQMFSKINQKRVNKISNVLLNQEMFDQENFNEPNNCNQEQDLEDEILNISSSNFKGNSSKIIDSEPTKNTEAYAFKYPSLQGYDFNKSKVDEPEIPVDKNFNVNKNVQSNNHDNFPDIHRMFNLNNFQNVSSLGPQKTNNYQESNMPYGGNYPFEQMPFNYNNQLPPNYNHQLPTNCNNIPSTFAVNSGNPQFVNQNYHNSNQPNFINPSVGNSQNFIPQGGQCYGNPYFSNFNSYPQNQPSNSHYSDNQRIPHFNKINLKFNGRGQSLHSFLEKVEEFRLSHRIPKESLLNFAHEFFEGDTLIWYRSVRNSIFSWSDLIYRLRLDFLPIDFEVALWDEVRARTQGNSERPLIYIAVMENLFGRFINRVDENTQLRLIMRNLLPYYQQQLVLRQPVSLSELKNLCRILEDTKVRSELFQGPPSCTSSTLEPELAYKKEFSNKSNSRFQYSNKTNTNEVNVTQSHSVSELPGDLIKFESSENITTKNQDNEPGMCALNLASTKCWNCDQLGHVFPDCKLKRNYFCFGCGKKNVIKSKCFNCKSKNVEQASPKSVDFARKEN